MNRRPKLPPLKSIPYPPAALEPASPAIERLRADVLAGVYTLYIHNKLILLSHGWFEPSNPTRFVVHHRTNVLQEFVEDILGAMFEEMLAMGVSTREGFGDGNTKCIISKATFMTYHICVVRWADGTTMIVDASTPMTELRSALVDAKLVVRNLERIRHRHAPKRKSGGEDTPDGTSAAASTEQTPSEPPRRVRFE
jgi:hypothetical protein